jgi:pimeloyl-ACP methyl ester carboxylesterase
MRDELTRTAAAVPVGALLGLIYTRSACSRLLGAALGGALVLCASLPHLDSWRSWVAIGVAGLAAAVMPAGKRGWLPAMIVALVVALSATAAAAAAVDLGHARHALTLVGRSSGVAIVAVGGVGAIFAGGEIVARILHPFARKAVRGDVGMERAGRYIGWLERTLVYVLFLAGASDAAALVIAGKSIARFPSFSEEKFAEYYLIGSLLSLMIAASCAVAVRAALGLAPLPPSKL